MQCFLQAGAVNWELEMHQRLQRITLRRFPELRTCSRNESNTFGLVCAHSPSAKWLQACIVFEKEGLAGLLLMARDLKQAQLHALHALCLLMRHIEAHACILLHKAHMITMLAKGPSACCMCCAKHRCSCHMSCQVHDLVLIQSIWQGYHHTADCNCPPHVDVHETGAA